MSTLIVLLYILFVAAAIILTVVILLQEGKGGGFGDALGAAGQQAFGVKASGVQRFTMWVALTFLSSAVLIHVLNNRRQSADDMFEEGSVEVIDSQGTDFANHDALLGSSELR